MKNIIKDGKSLTYTAASDILSGNIVPVGSAGLFGIASGDIATGETGELSLEDAVIELTAVSTGVIALGAAVYWDNGNSRVTSSASGNTRIGYAYEAKADGTAIIKVKIVHA